MSSLIRQKPPLDDIRRGMLPQTLKLEQQLEHIIKKYNFYPGVFYHENDINSPDGIRYHYPDLDKYNGVFVIVDAPDVPIKDFKGVEIRPSITKGMSTNQIPFQYMRFNDLPKYEPINLDKPSVWFSGDVTLLSNGQLFPQQEPRYRSVISLGTCGLNTQIDLRLTQFNNGSFNHISGRRLEPFEFYQSMKAHPYGLAVRGWGNYSARFYELLAMGRIPVYIDTNAPLLFEEHISWDDYIVRITNLNEIHQKVTEFHSQFTDDKSFINFQKKLVNLYHEYCTVEGYIKHFDLYEDKINKIIGNSQ